MIHPLPPGTRDVLPDEMRELRSLSDRMRSVFEAAGYGEVRTPAIEYEDVLRRGDERAAGASFRLFDEAGRVMALRSDTTIPIARLVATRYVDAPLPIRLSYFDHAYRPARPGRGQATEFMQAGVELLGLPSPDGDVEVIALVLEALDAAGLGRHRVGIGDGSLYRRLLWSFGVPEAEHAGLLDYLSRRDLVGLERRLAALPLAQDARDALVGVPGRRGGAEVLEATEPPVKAALDGLAACYHGLAPTGAQDRVILDLGLVRELGYYTGVVFEVYDPAVGFALGGGGRYDELLGRFGRPLPACGFALDVHRVHTALMEEERLASASGSRPAEAGPASEAAS